MAVLKPGSGANLATIPAGLWAVQVNTGTTDTPDWEFVNGLTSYGPVYDLQSEDDSDINMGGWRSEAPTGNGMSVTFEGLVKGTEAEGEFTPDPGMAVLIAASKSTGNAAIREFRHWRVDSLDEAEQFFAVVKASLTAGRPTELQKFSGELIAKGQPEQITKPEDPENP